MRSLNWLIITTVFLFCNVNARALEYDASRPIYDINKEGRRVDELTSVLDTAYAKGKPVLIYLHGRGDEPAKSFGMSKSKTGSGALPRLEKEYGVSVVMVNWNSKSSGRDRKTPLDQIPEGALHFDAAMARLKEYRNANPDKPAPSLLVHSMGSIVLASAIEAFEWRGSQGKPLFSNVLLSQPDSDAQGHDVWLSKLAAIERVYVTQNKSDPVLKRSDDREPASNTPLGLKPVAPFAAGAVYVDLTGSLRIKRIVGLIKIGAHQIFKKSWMRDYGDTCSFITRVLLGESFTISSHPGISSTAPGQYVLKSSKKSGHSCFSAADPDGDDEE
jgi:hypothetical protein